MRYFVILLILIPISSFAQDIEYPVSVSANCKVEGNENELCAMSIKSYVERELKNLDGIYLSDEPGRIVIKLNTIGSRMGSFTFYSTSYLAVFQENDEDMFPDLLDSAILTSSDLKESADIVTVNFDQSTRVVIDYLVGQ